MVTVLVWLGIVVGAFMLLTVVAIVVGKSFETPDDIDYDEGEPEP